MARDLFQEAGFDPSSEDSGRDLFEEAGLTSGQDGKERKKRKSQATAADYLRAMDSGLAQGVAGIAGGIGTFIQDPAANALSGVSGAAAAADRGITWAANAISGKDISKENEAIQENARMASRFAAESRDAQAADPSNLPARFGRMLQRDSERANAEILASDKANNPELIAQQQNTAEAQGFVDNLAAIKDNPLAFAHTMARSAPDMAAGVGVGSVVHRAGASLGRVSTAGALSEASSSALQSRQGVYQQVNEMPLEMLAKSPRFQAVLAETQGDPAKAREILANELADQVPLLAGAGTALGTVLTNKLFGGDATAKTIAGVERMGIREFGKRVAQDTVEEGFQGVPEDAVQYGASVQADPSQQYDPGGSAAQNLAAGFAMGSGGHGLGYARDTFRGSNVQNQTPAENQQNQAPALSGQAQAATNSGAAAGNAAARGSSAGLEAVGVGDTAAAEEALKTPVQLTALDRADALGGELQAITERQQEMAPENGYGPAFDGERQDLATKAAELAAERDSIAATWPKAERGAMSSFTTEAGARLDAQYALMDAGDLVTSHDEGLAVNPLFPKELQPRDRSRQASELQVSGIVQRLDPARLGLSADAANGAPIVGADGLVESGNARTIALKRVYQANGQKAENYKQFLRDNAAQFGLAPEAIDAMAKPVLVRVRATPVNRAEFARQANASTVQRMSPSEQALSDAKRLNSLDGLNPDEQGDFGNNMDFVRQFMATLPVTEQSDLIESDGRLSTAGYRRIQNAVLARAYGDSPSLRRMTESMDNNLANISKALVRVAPTIAAARERMDAGTLHQADIAPDLLAAVEGLSALKEKGWKVSDELGQADLTGPKYSPEAAELLTFLSENARSPRRIAEFFQRYYDALEHAGDPTQPSMFGDDGPAPTRASLINTAKETQNGNADQDPQRGVAGEGAQADARDGGQPQNAPRSEGRNQGNGPAQADAAGRQPGKPAQEAANDAVGEWVHFPEDSGTLGIPRSDMPQVKGEHRGALVNFLNARGISSTKDEVPASSLKPTQAEFSREKTERFMKTGPIGERSVLVSSDGHVLDGHHQWMAMKALGESVPVIRLDAPIRQLLDEVREFPSVQQSEGDKTPVGQRAAAVQDFKDALGDLAQIASKHTRAAMMPEKTPDLMPVLAKLFDAAIRLVGTDMKRATKWVREQIKADPRFKTFWNKISPEIYQKAALQAMEGMANPAQDGLFGDIGEAASAVQDDLFNSPAKATEDTSAVSKIESKAYDRDRDNYRPPSAKTFLPAELIARANGYIGKYSKQPRPMVVAPKDRARAKAELKPLLDAALGAFQGFARNVAAVAQQSGALGQIVASVKNMDRAVEKYVDPDGADFSPERMRDLLRATVVVSSYGDVQAVVDAVVKVFGSVARVKTRISEDARIDGYADVLLNVVLPDGVAAEIQINVPQMLAAKDAQGHKLYEAQRVQPEASAAYKEIGDAMREFYDAAFAAAGNNLTLPVAANSRQPRAQFKKTASEIGAADRVGSDLTGSKSDPLSSSLKTLPSGSSTNSSPLNDATNSQPGGNLSGTFIGTPPASILRADAKNSEPEPAGAVRTATQIATDIAKAQPDGDVAALRERVQQTANDLLDDLEREYYERIGVQYVSYFDRKRVFVTDEVTTTLRLTVPVTDTDYLRTLLDRCLEDGFLGVEVVDEIRRDEALVEADALADVEFGVHRGGLHDADDAVAADLGHRLAHEFTDLLVARGHGGDLGDAVLAGDRDGRLQQRQRNRIGGLADAQAQRDRVGSGRDVAQTGLDDGLRQHGGGGGAVAGFLAGARGYLAQHLRAHVLELVLEFDLFGDRNAVLGDAGRAEALLDDDVAALGAERHLDGVGENVDAAEHAVAGIDAEFDFFSCHLKLLKFDLFGTSTLGPAVVSMVAKLLLQDTHDVFFTHDQDFLAIDLDGLAGVLAEQNAVADLDVESDLLAVVVALARADGHDFTLGGLFLGRIRNDDATGGDFVGFDRLGFSRRRYRCRATARSRAVAWA